MPLKNSESTAVIRVDALITLYREITTMSATTLLLEKPQVKVGPGVRHERWNPTIQMSVVPHCEEADFGKGEQILRVLVVLPPADSESHVPAVGMLLARLAH